MGQKIELSDLALKQLKDGNTQFIIDHTFPNAGEAEKTGLLKAMYSWPPKRLEGLRAIIDTHSYDEARRLMLGWL